MWFAREFLLRSEPFRVRVRSVDIDRFESGIDAPDEGDSGVEVFLNLLIHILDSVGRRQDFDSQDRRPVNHCRFRIVTRALLSH